MITICAFFSRPSFARTEITPVETNVHQAEDTLQALDKAFRDLGYVTYEHYNKNFISKEIGNIRNLEKNVRQLEANGDTFNAILLIKANQNTINSAINDQAVQYFINLLLKHNARKSANSLYKQVKTNGDNFSNANVSFLYTRYFFERQQWEQASQSFNGKFEDLTVKDAHFALLIQGVSLQRLKRHRQAIKYYQRIPASSTFYPHAQLNIAIAYIRQGWWSDARLIINNLTTPDLKTIQQTFSHDISDRAKLVLAYALFQQEYFRDSRNLFRNITLHSPYHIQALMGIGLTSSSQEDYIGALNAFSQLKKHPPQNAHLYSRTNLAVDESWLLEAYIYERMNQGVTASTLYSEAIKYYQSRVNILSSRIQIRQDETTATLKESLFTDLEKQKTLLQEVSNEFKESLPKYFLSNLSEINQLSINVEEPVLKQQVLNLQKRYYNQLQQLILQSLEEHRVYLNSYLNQSRLGLARLYDNSLLNKH